jgi:K(+)-stimulated pyrophosphate-energized sodium pump
LLTYYFVLNVSHFQVGSIIAAVTLARGDIALVMYPFWIAGAGIIAAMFGYFAVSARDGATQQQLMFALHKGTIVSSVLVIGFGAVITPFVFEDRTDYGWRVFSCICIGLAAGIMIGQVTEFFTSYAFWPTQSITDAGVTGPATVIIQGLGIGMISTVFPVIIIVATILGCNALAGEYGIAMSAVGMLSTLYVLSVSIRTIPLSLLAISITRSLPLVSSQTTVSRFRLFRFDGLPFTVARHWQLTLTVQWLTMRVVLPKWLRWMNTCATLRTLSMPWATRLLPQVKALPLDLPF